MVTNTTPISAYRRRGAAGSHCRDRAGGRSVRRGDWHGPGRGADGSSWCHRSAFPRHREWCRRRLRGRRRGAGKGCCDGRLRAPRAEQATARDRRHGALGIGVRLRGDHRGRRGSGRDGAAGGARRRHGDRVHLQLAARPGPRYRLGDARTGRTRDPYGAGHRDRWRPMCSSKGVGTYASRSLQLGGRPCIRPRSRSGSRRGTSRRTCWRQATPTWYWTRNAACGRCGAIGRRA